MKRLIVPGLLLLFLVAFLVASSFRFQHLIFECNHSFKIVFPLLLLSMLAGIVLVEALRRASLLALPLWQHAVYGAVSGIMVFFFIFGVEDALSARSLFGNPRPVDFELVRGHCGVYSGRALVKLYNRAWSASMSDVLFDFRISNECRTRRFEEVVMRKKDGCPDSSEPECMMRWMKVFAEHGYWNAAARKMFLKQMARRWSSAPSIPDSLLMEYALRDHELEMASPTVLKQAGIEEVFGSEEYDYYRHLEDAENLRVSKDVVDAVAKALRSEPSPEFSEIAKAVAFRYERLAEIEKEAAELKARMR